MSLVGSLVPSLQSQAALWICRDKSCDIRIVNKEVSRRHLEVYVNDDGNVCVLSMGREPVCLNGEQVLSPRVLQTGDKIEVMLEGRTREFYFQAAKIEAAVAETQPVEHGGIGSPLAASSIANQQARVASGDAVAVEEVNPLPQIEEEEYNHEEQPAEEAVGSEWGMAEEFHPRVIAEAVSRMVDEIMTRVVASSEVAASILTPVTKGNKRKSVRFVALTPEGDAQDATMTIRCTPRKDGDAVMVEDNTVAFSDWGFKSMAQEDNADKQEVHMTEVRGTPASLQASQEASLDRRMTPTSTDMEGVDLHCAPSQTTPCLAAPATTPVTMTKSGTMQKRSREVDFSALAKKLGEIAEEHDVQFELPKDFMRFTPLSTCKSKKISMSEVCQSSLSKRLSICSSSKEDMEYDVPKDFMRFTPMSVAAKSVQRDMKSGASGESEKGGDVSVGCMRSTPLSAIGSKKQTSSTNGTMEYDVPKDFMRFTPMSVPSKRVDEGKIKSALKVIGQPLSAIGTIHESEDDGAEEIATLRSVGHAVHDLADALEHVASVKKSSCRLKTPGVKITIVEKGDTFKTSNPEVKVLFDGMPGLDAGVEQQSTGNAQQSAGNVQMTKTSSKVDLLSRFKSALIQANSYRTQSLVLGKHLRKSSAKLSKIKATAHILSTRYKAERAKRIELQNALKKLIEVREAEDAEMSTQDEEEIENTRVVVVGYHDKDPTDALEIAGDVVVVRRPPDMSMNLGASLTPRQPTTSKKSRRASVAKSALKSVKRISIGAETHLIMDDVKMPTWIYDKEDDEDDQKADLQDEREQYSPEEKKALDTLENSLKSPMPEGPSEEEEELIAEDICHICQVGDDGDILLLCDSCDNACHLQCCKPPLKRVPKGDWYCIDCKQKSKPAPKKATAKRRAPAATKASPAKKQAKENAPAPGSKTRPTRTAAKSKPATQTRRSRAKKA